MRSAFPVVVQTTPTSSQAHRSPSMACQIPSDTNKKTFFEQLKHPKATDQQPARSTARQPNLYSSIQDMEAALLLVTLSQKATKRSHQKKKK